MIKFLVLIGQYFVHAPQKVPCNFNFMWSYKCFTIKYIGFQKEDSEKKKKKKQV